MSDRRTPVDDHRQCRRCGSPVSRNFVRVFGVENAVHGCINCLSRRQLAEGKAAPARVDGTADVDRWTTWSSSTGESRR